MTDMKIAPAHLERWMRKYYFDTDIDLGSSGMESFLMSEICSLVGLKFEELGKVVFNDSQTLGGSGLREAMANRWTGGDCGKVMATQGSSEAIFLVMNALLNADDEVVVLEPAYQQLYAIVESIGCRVKHWQLRFEHGFTPNLEELAGLLNPKTRMVIVNFPHNPTGASVSANDQARLIEIVAKTGAYLVWDAAFADLVYDEPRLPDPILLYERTVTLGTLSKAYGLAGLRVGWCLAAPDVLERCVYLRDYTTLYLSPLVELIAQRVIENADAILAIQLKQVKRNLEIVSN
jgi:aspartate/methionine/tyrosine aminotransferase